MQVIRQDSFNRSKRIRFQGEGSGLGRTDSLLVFQRLIRAENSVAMLRFQFGDLWMLLGRQSQ
jgi:hypothetical protein